MTTETIKKSTDAQRMLNSGATMFHKGLGRELTVKELSMESIINCASELAVLMTTVDWASHKDNLNIVPLLLKEEATANACRTFAAESTGTSVDDWKGIPASDWLRFVVAAKKVNDWAELKTLFLEAGLAAHFKKATSQASPTPSENASEGENETGLPGQ